MSNNKIDVFLSETVDFLEQIIRFPSLGGQEEDVIRFMFKAFSPLADEVTLVPLSDDLLNDPEYSSPIPDIKYNGRHYLRLKVNGTGSGQSIILNAHSDVVPASAKDRDQFIPYQKDGFVYGRGACDDKGQIATFYLLLKIIKEKGLKFEGDIIFHIVVEEENGGNGTLAAIRSGDKADAVIVLESSSLKIFSSVRGAVWFKVTCFGEPGHSGFSGKSASALKMAVRVMQILENYHKKLLSESKGFPLFDEYENPMPITFGKLHAGDWPAATPGKAVLEGVLGLLPNKTRFKVMQEMEAEIRQNSDDFLRDNFKLEFTYRHDAHTLDVNHPLITVLSEACSQSGIEPQTSAMVASCDSWFYSKLLNIPSVVFGPGDLIDAHTSEEHIEVEQIQLAAEILLNFVSRWCGESN
ncbi:MAG: M20/M25/M40 family metallo-hydrolase [Bacteroidetes bacterium]|nr:M20/M25/M40 family metallo-hydrolase [Bacteroidota bacterium]